MAAIRIVIETKRLLEEAQGWWAWSWALDENKLRVRSAIESATAALDREVGKAKNFWKGDKRAGKALKDAEDEFNRATSLAKKMFDEAEKEWNATKARDGAALARQAIEKHEVVLKLAKAGKTTPGE